MNNAFPDRQKVLSELKWPLIIFFVAVFVRTVYFVSFLQTPFAELYFADQAYYRDWAMRIAAGNVWGREVFEQTPLYPYLLALCYRLKLSEIGVMAGQLLIGASSCLLVYACGKRIFNSQTAILAGLVAAVYGPSIYYECSIMKTFLSPLFTVAALYSGLRYADKRSLKWLFLCGLAIGLACLEREIHLLLLVPVVNWALRQSRGPQVSLVQRTLPVFIPVMACGFVILPVTIRNYIVSGELVAVTTGGGEVFYIAYGPYASGYYRPPAFIHPLPTMEHEDFRNEARRRTGRQLTRTESSRYWFQESINEAIRHPGRTAILTLKKAAILANDFEVPDSSIFVVTREFIPVLRFLPSYGWIVGLGVLGIVLCLGDYRQYSLLLGFAAMHVLSVLMTYNFGRFRMGLIPVLILFAAHGACWIIAGIRQPTATYRRRALLALAVAASISLMAMLPPVDYNRMPYEKGNRELRELVNEHLALKSQRRELETELARGHEDAETDIQLGNVLLKLSKPNEAIERYRKALQLSRNATGYLQLARALATIGRMREAQWRLEDAIACDRDNCEAHEEYGQLLLKAGQAESATRELGEAVRLDPKIAIHHMWLGMAYMQFRSYEQAEREFRAALDLDPGHAMSHYYLGSLYGKLGRKTEAIEEISNAVKFEPDFPQAHQLLLQLTDVRASNG